MPHVVAIVSGGLDSTVMAYQLQDQGYDLHIVTFDYGQRHVKEIGFAEMMARDLGAEFHLIDVSDIKALLAGSALTDDAVEVPDGPYDENTMSVTVVPNRNAIMLAVAYGFAASQGYEAVAIATHAGDHALYPDCRKSFMKAFRLMEAEAIGPLVLHPELLTPFIDNDKAAIVKVGHELGVPFERTWSCYKGGEKHCGVCGTCQERRAAFEAAGISDPTEYENG